MCSCVVSWVMAFSLYPHSTGQESFPISVTMAVSVMVGHGAVSCTTLIPVMWTGYFWRSFYPPFVLLFLFLFSCEYPVPMKRRQFFSTSSSLSAHFWLSSVKINTIVGSNPTSSSF